MSRSLCLQHLAWAAHHIAFVISEGIFKGFPDKSFKHKNHLSAEQFATILRRILKHDNESFGQNIQELNKLGINIQSAEQIKRGDAFDAFFTAAVLPIHNSGNSLIHVLGKEELAIQKGFINENKAHELIINNVEADNLKQIKVSFNQKVSKDNLGEFKLSDKNLEVSAMLSPEDDSVVILTLKTKLKDQKEYTLTAEKTKADNDNVEPLKKSEVKFTPSDVALPTVKEVEFTGPNHVTVTFSEPVQSNKGTLDVLLGKTKLGVSTDITVSGNKATLKLFSSLKEDKEYKINVKEFKDYKELPNVQKEFTLTYSKNTEAPEVTISNVTQTSAVFTFSKPVKGLKADKFHHTFAKYEAFTVKDMDGVSVDENKAYTAVKVVFYNDGTDKHQPIRAGKGLVWIDGAKVTDLWGNKLGDQQFEVAIEADQTAPEVTEIKVLDEKTIRVIFSEDVQKKTASADLRKSFTVKSGSDNVLKAAVEVSGKKDQINLTVADNLRNKELSIEIDKLYDCSPNKNEIVYKGSVKVVDKTPPVIDKVTADIETDKKSGKIYVIFNEVMDPASALDVANYSFVNPVDGKSVYTKLSGVIDFFNDNSVVVIELSEDEIKKLKVGTTILAVGAIKDVAENDVAVRMSGAITGHKSEMAIRLEQYKKADGTPTGEYMVEAISPTKIKVTFNQKVYHAPKEAFAIAGKTIVNAEPQDGEKTVIITLDKKNKLAGHDETAITDVLEIKKDHLKGEFTDDKANNVAYSVPGGAVKIYNKIAPAVARYAADHPDPKLRGKEIITVKDGKISIVFTREIEDSISAAVLGANFVVKRDGTPLSAASGEYSVALKGGDQKTVEITLDNEHRVDGEYTVELNNDEREDIFAEGMAKRERIVAKSFAYTFYKEDSATLDVSRPTIEKVEKLTETSPAKTSIVVTFTEDVDETTAKDTSKYDFKQADGSSNIAITGNGTVSGKTVTFELTTPSELTPGSYVAVKAGVKDKNDNTTVASEKFAYNKNDEFVPESELPKVVSVTQNATTVTVTFDKEIDGAGIADAWFTTEGTSFTTVTGVAVSSTNSKALTFTSEAAADAATDKVHVAPGKIFDKAGNPVLKVTYKWKSGNDFEIDN